MKARSRAVLVFGEDENDCRAVAELTRGSLQKGSSISVQVRRTPVVHIRATDKPSTRLDTATRIARQVAAEKVRSDIVSVIAHQDCDDVEPAHSDVAALIEGELTKAGVPNPIAAAPAWETETWLMQFPEALTATRGCWRKINYGNRDLGKIVNSKEKLRAALRPTEAKLKQKCRDYSESDAPIVAAKARELNIIHSKRTTKCDSFVEFIQKIALIK